MTTGSQDPAPDGLDPENEPGHDQDSEPATQPDGAAGTSTSGEEVDQDAGAATQPLQVEFPSRARRDRASVISRDWRTNVFSVPSGYAVTSLGTRGLGLAAWSN